MLPGQEMANTRSGFAMANNMLQSLKCLTYPCNCMSKSCKEIQGIGGRQPLVPNFFLPDFVSQLKTHRTLWTPTSFLSFGQILTEELPCQQSIWKGKVLFSVVSSKMLTNFWETLLHSLTGPVSLEGTKPMASVPTKSQHACVRALRWMRSKPVTTKAAHPEYCLLQRCCHSCLPNCCCCKWWPTRPET